MLKKTLMLALTAAFIVSLAGCNTIHGVGEDLEVAGEGLQDAASE